MARYREKFNQHVHRSVYWVNLRVVFVIPMFETGSTLTDYIRMIFNLYFIGSVLSLYVPNIYQLLRKMVTRNYL